MGFVGGRADCVWRCTSCVGGCADCVWRYTIYVCADWIVDCVGVGYPVFIYHWGCFFSFLFYAFLILFRIFLVFSKGWIFVLWIWLARKNNFGRVCVWIWNYFKHCLGRYLKKVCFHVNGTLKRCNQLKN